MSRECQDCKHSHLWTYEEKLAYYKDMVDHGVIPYNIDHYICDKIPEGQEFPSDDGTEVYTYDGYSLEGECYDEVFGCFERRVENEL